MTDGNAAMARSYPDSESAKGPEDCAEHMLLQARKRGQEQWTNIYAAQLAQFVGYGCEVRALPQPASVAQRPNGPVQAERHPGPFTGHDVDLARACAMVTIPDYGNDDPDTHQRIMRDGIWNDHIAVQAALTAIHSIRKAPAAPADAVTSAAQTVLAPDHVAVPKAALDWLFSQGPDDKGWLFGECSEAQKAMNTKNPRRYWWRAKFRTMLSAVPSTMPLPAAPQPVAWRWREITSAPDDWHYQAIEPRFINPPHFIVEPLSALTSTEEK